MTAALIPGSFDPVTNGHVDIVERVAATFDRVLVAVVVNPKKTGLFEIAERVGLLREVLAHLGNVDYGSFDGLVVDYAERSRCDVIVKGLRTSADFEYELEMARMNRRMTGIDTYFLAAAPSFSSISSSLIREVAKLGGNISGLVPSVVEQHLKERFARP